MIIFVAAFIILLCVSAPITVALGGCALVYALVADAAPITTLIQTIFGGLATFPLLARRLAHGGAGHRDVAGRVADGQAQDDHSWPLGGCSCFRSWSSAEPAA